MYRVKSDARFARVSKAVLGIQSYLEQPVRRVIFARAADVRYERRIGNARVHHVSTRNTETVIPPPLISVTHLHSPLPLRILQRELSHPHNIREEESVRSRNGEEIK